MLGVAGIAVVALLIGLWPAKRAIKPPAIGAIKAQLVKKSEPRRGIVVVGFARGRRLRVRYPGGCRGRRLRRSVNRMRRFAIVVRRNHRRCGRQRLRRGWVMVTACAGGQCVARQVHLSHFRDSDGDGLGDLYERFVLHTPVGGSQPGSTPTGEPEVQLSPLGKLGCIEGQAPVTSADELLDQVGDGHSVCVTAPIGNVRLEGFGGLEGVTISSEGSGSIGEIAVKETSKLTIQGARLRSIEIRRANGTRVISSVIGGSQANRVEDQLIFMPESSSDVLIESNDIGWTVADDSGNTGYGCRCYGNLDRLHFVGNRVHDIAADGFQGVGGTDVVIDRNEIGPVGANPDSSEHSDNIQITGNDAGLRITNNWIHHQGYYEGKAEDNAGSTYIHGGSTGSLLYENNLIETNQGRTEICGLGTGGISRSNITIRRNTWIDGGKAFANFPGFEWDCDSGSNDTITRNIAIDPAGGFADNGFNAAIVEPNLFGTPSLVTLDAARNCTSANCNPAGQEPIGYRKPLGVHW